MTFISINYYDIVCRLIKKGGSWIFGSKPAIHRIPFGPLKGRYIFMSFDISPRLFFGFGEPWIAALAQQYLRPGDIVYDLGAHIGYTSLVFAQQVGHTGAVHAFEIVPSIAEQFLKTTIQANNFNNIVVHTVGLSDKEQVLKLPVGETMMTSLYLNPIGEKVELCKTVRLDQYIAQEHLPVPALIKIDIECAEIECLAGGVELLKKCTPLMIIEFHSLDLLKQGYSFLTPLGYKLTTQHETIDNDWLQTKKQFHESVFCSAGTV